MLRAIDTLDWATFRSTFAAEISLDYTSLWGGEPELTTVEDLVARWQSCPVSTRPNTSPDRSS
jgi:hypothetical protein